LAVDAQRSLVSLMYPPHEVAIASLYVGATLASNLPVATNEPTSMTVADGEEALSLRTSQEIAIILSKSGDWEERFHAFHQDVDRKRHKRSTPCRF
jgi:CTD kinase subunit beta